MDSRCPTDVVWEPTYDLMLTSRTPSLVFLKHPLWGSDSGCVASQWETDGRGSYFIWAFLFVARDLDEQVQYGIIEIEWSLFTCISRVSKVLISVHLLSYPRCRVVIMRHVAQELLMIAKLS